MSIPYPIFEYTSAGSLVKKHTSPEKASRKRKVNVAVIMTACHKSSLGFNGNFWSDHRMQSETIRKICEKK